MAVDIIARGMAASGVKLGSDGKIPADLLPSYVDDITDLIAVDSAAPAQCSEGDKYYNTTDKLIYTATGTNTWGSTGETPEDGKIYLNISANPATSYRWSGTDLVEVGQDLSNYMTLDSAQTVTGVKTFSNLPESSATPTTNNQLANKKYVDDTVNAENKNVEYLGYANDYTPENRLDITNFKKGIYLLTGNASGTIKLPSYLYLTCTKDGVVHNSDIQLNLYKIDYEFTSCLWLIIDKPISEANIEENFGALAVSGIYDSYQIVYNRLYLQLSTNGIAYIPNRRIINYSLIDMAQNIIAKKTFTVLPESSVVPTTDNQLVNKKYVDDNAGGYSNMFSTDVNSFNNDATTREKVAEFITKNKGNMVFFCIAASPTTSYNSPTSGAAIFKMYVNGIFSSANYHGVKITGSPYGESYQSGSVLDVGGLEIKGTWSNDIFTLTSASVYTTDTADCYLSTSRNVNFVPTAAGHPTTKRYVDDNISENTWLLTDNAGLFNKLYVTSSSALSTDVPQTTVEYLGSGVYTLSYTYTTDQVVTPATRYILHLVKSTTGSIWTQDVYCDIYIKRNNTNVLTTKTETFKLNGVSSPETYTSVDFKFDLNITEPFSIQSGDVFQIQIHTQGGQFGGSLYSSSVNPTYISQCTNGINAQYVYDTIDGVTYSQHDINAMIGNINTVLATLTTPNNGGGN